MSGQSSLTPDQIEEQLCEDIAGFTHDPLGYALYAFPWGENELADASGPREWQREVMRSIGDKLRANLSLDAWEVVQDATASGHGIGKSALVAMLTLWLMSTHEDTRGVITANTDTQLRTKTWPEISKWHRLAINKHWFTLTATAMFSAEKGRDKTWRVDIIPWSENNTEAFAGLHNKGKRIFVVFDEASAIDDKIWEVTEGALTDEFTEIVWLAFGNPTRSTGRFRECFGRLRHRWTFRNIDSRKVEGTNKKQLDKWVQDYGEDSDFVRVRVRGQFPAVGANALLGDVDVERAMTRHLRPEQYEHAARLLGVDVARFGDDRSVIYARQGGASFKPVIMRGADTTQVAGRVAMAIDRFKPDAVFVDGSGGYGAGVIDILRRAGHPIIEVQFGGKAIDPRFKNKRTEMWWLMADWVRKTGALAQSQDLTRELVEPTYWFVNDQFELESKDDIKERLGESPDLADALALTFAMPIAPRIPGVRAEAAKVRTEYDPLAAVFG